MKAVILAGGYGTRIGEETELKPKPMIEIGGKPILWHIMKIYSSYDINEFIVLIGYKGYMIKEYFANYFLHQSDVTIDLENNSLEIHKTKSEPWKITLIDTGLNTMTGGRIKMAQKYLDDETFMLTYGDGVSDININELLKFHKDNNKFATLTAVQPLGRYGVINLGDKNTVTSFNEKIQGDNTWINAGFFVLEPQIFDYIENDFTMWEKTPVENLCQEGQLGGYKHRGFWKSMDTPRDKIELEELWSKGNPPWKIWK